VGIIKNKISFIKKYETSNKISPFPTNPPLNEIDTNIINIRSGLYQKCIFIYSISTFNVK
jgi:hypothetical protein